MTSLKSLNKSELVIGLIFGLIFAVKIGWWALALAPVTSFLWAAGGLWNKAFRRIGCALLPCLAVWAVSGWWWAILAFPLAFGVLCIGYGIPTTQPPDEGSFLGRFAYSLVSQQSGWTVVEKEQIAEILTRTLIYFLLSVAFIPCWAA